MKRELVAFFENSGFVGGVSPSEEEPRKQKKRFLETHLLVEDDTKREDRQVIFGE